MGINMEKRIKKYRREIDELLARLEEKPDGTDVERLIRQHLTQIGFFQHERLIHLMVTALFALLEMLAILLTVLSAEIGPMLLALFLLILLIPYVRHYYILENEVQRMYTQYDRLLYLLQEKASH